MKILDRLWALASIFVCLAALLPPLAGWQFILDDPHLLHDTKKYVIHALEVGIIVAALTMISMIYTQLQKVKPSLMGERFRDLKQAIMEMVINR